MASCMIGIEHLETSSDRELSSIGLKVVEPSAGYYIFPNFEVIRESLKARGIHSGEAMCQAIFEEAKVAVSSCIYWSLINPWTEKPQDLLSQLMAGGPAFLRPKNELTTRLCFVNFNGSEALAASRKIGAEKELPENFVQVYCTPVFKGIQVRLHILPRSIACSWNSLILLTNCMIYIFYCHIHSIFCHFPLSPGFEEMGSRPADDTVTCMLSFLIKHIN